MLWNFVGRISGRTVDRKEDGRAGDRSQVKYLQVIEDSLGWDGYQKLLKLLQGIAEKYQVGISQVASKYILSQEGVGAAIIGIRNSRHVEDNLKISLSSLNRKKSWKSAGFWRHIQR